MRKYEIMYIVDPNLPEEEIDELNKQIENIITDADEAIVETEKISRRKLAYEMKRRTEGFYLLLRVEADGEIVSEVERRFRVMDNVLRYLTVRIDLTEKKNEKMRAIREKQSAGRGVKQPEPEAAEQPAAN